MVVDIKPKGVKQNRSRKHSSNLNEKKKGSLEYQKNDDNVNTSILESIMSFWEQQFFPIKWSEMYNQYAVYAKQMVQINEEFITRSQKIAQLCIELSENAQRINELFKESIKLTEGFYKNWLNAYYPFLNINKNEAPLSGAIEKKEKEKANEKTVSRKVDANLTKDEQKTINNMFKESLTFD
jgi:hypothetical protein